VSHLSSYLVVRLMPGTTSPSTESERCEGAIIAPPETKTPAFRPAFLGEALFDNQATRDSSK
jgi:hypothetical protein